MRRICFALLALLPGASALAQVSAQAGIASDYVFRGVSLTQGRPVATLEVDYDAAAGWFAGGLATATHLYTERRYEPEYVIDAGYAHALDAGLTWEVGATYAVFGNYTFWNYAELFAGVLGERWNARLYHAADYFGRGKRTWYGEFNYALPLDAHWRILAHAGAVEISRTALDPKRRTLDASVGVAAKFGSASLEIKRSVTNHESYLYPLEPSQARGAWIVSVAYSY
jgi:uncharacterized protein (TIGR02001 family)